MHGTHAHAGGGAFHPTDLLKLPLLALAQQVEQALQVGSRLTGLIAHALVCGYFGVIMWRQYWDRGMAAWWYLGDRYGLNVYVGYLLVRGLSILYKNYLRNHALYQEALFVGEGSGVLILSDWVALCTSGAYLWYQTRYQGLGHYFYRGHHGLAHKVMLLSLGLVPLIRLIRFSRAAEWQSLRASPWNPGSWFHRSTRRKSAYYSQWSLLLQEILELGPALLTLGGYPSSHIEGLWLISILWEQVCEQAVAVVRVGIDPISTPSGRQAGVIAAMSVGLALVHAGRAQLLGAVSRNPLTAMASRAYYATFRVVHLAVLDSIRQRLRRDFLLYRS